MRTLNNRRVSGDVSGLLYRVTIDCVQFHQSFMGLDFLGHFFASYMSLVEAGYYARCGL